MLARPGVLGPDVMGGGACSYGVGFASGSATAEELLRMPLSRCWTAEGARRQGDSRNAAHTP